VVAEQNEHALATLRYRFCYPTARVQMGLADTTPPLFAWFRQPCGTHRDHL